MTFDYPYENFINCPFFYIILFSPTFAQETGYLPGYIVTNSKDTIKGLVKYANFAPYRVLLNIKFKETEESKKTTYSPTEIIAYQADGKIFHSLKAPGHLEKHFMELVIDGDLRLYRYTETMLGAPDYSRGQSANMTGLFLKKRDKELLDLSNLKFKEPVSEYLSDNKELSDKIKNGEYKKRNTEEIVRQYNKIKDVSQTE